MRLDGVHGVGRRAVPAVEALDGVLEARVALGLLLAQARAQLVDRARELVPARAPQRELLLERLLRRPRVLLHALHRRAERGDVVRRRVRLARRDELELLDLRLGAAFGDNDPADPTLQCTLRYRGAVHDVSAPVLGGDDKAVRAPVIRVARAAAPMLPGC